MLHSASPAEKPNTLLSMITSRGVPARPFMNSSRKCRSSKRNCGSPLAGTTMDDFGRYLPFALDTCQISRPCQQGKRCDRVLGAVGSKITFSATLTYRPARKSGQNKDKCPEEPRLLG